MRRAITLAAVTATTLGVVACGGEATTEVTLGAIVSLQGAGAPYGNSVQRGVELAVEEINAAGGVNVFEMSAMPINLMVRDAQSNPATGVQVANELIDAGVHAVIGADVSDVTLGIAPVFQEREVMLMSPASSSPKLTDAGDFIYRNFPSDDLEALNTADFVYNARDVQEAAVIGQQSEFGLGQKNSFIQRFRLLGGRALAQESYPPNASADEIASHVERLIADGPGAIYIAGYTDDTAMVARAIREAGSDAALFGTGAVLADGLVAAGGDAVEGLAYPQASFDPDSSDGTVRAFVTAYEAKYGTTPDVYAAHAYDAVKMIVLAIEQAGLDGVDMKSYINIMNPYPGVTGSTDFDDNGDVRKFHTMYGIQEGAAVRLE